MRRYQYDGPKQALPEYGINANIVKTKEFDLAAARDKVCYEMGGSCLWCINAEESGTIDMDAWIDIYLNDQMRDPIRFKLGTYISNVPFSRFYVSHDAQANKTLQIMYAREEIDNIRVLNPAINFANINTVQTIKVIERDESSWYDTLNNQNTFIGGAQCNQVAGQFSHVQLWNPNGSGINAIVKRVVGNQDTTDYFYLHYYATALTTDLPNNLGNKYLGGAAPACEIRRQTNAATLGTAITHRRAPTATHEAVEFLHHKGDCILIPPNMGLVVVSGGGNYTIQGGFEWMEVAV